MDGKDNFRPQFNFDEIDGIRPKWVGPEKKRYKFSKSPNTVLIQSISLKFNCGPRYYFSVSIGQITVTFCHFRRKLAIQGERGAAKLNFHSLGQNLDFPPLIPSINGDSRFQKKLFYSSGIPLFSTNQF